LTTNCVRKKDARREREEDAFVNNKILDVSWDENGSVLKQWIDIRPIPQGDTWFENVWNRYMNDDIVK
jgi:hypothetical protein